MSITSLTCRIFGTVAYTDGKKGTFAGVWDGKQNILPNTAEEIKDIKAAFNQDSIIVKFEEEMSGVSSFASSGATGVISFYYSTPTYPTDRSAVRDLVMSFSGNIAFSNGNKDSFEVTYQLNREQSSTVTSAALATVLADPAALLIVNNLLTAAAGFTLTIQ